MKMWGTMEPGERIASVLFAVLIASILIHDWMIRAMWVYWLIALALIWGVAALLAIFNIGFSLRDGEGWVRKVRGAVAIPLAVICAALMSMTGVGRVVAASAFHLVHRAELDRAQAQAGFGAPVALNFIEGIPDGGVAIIRSSVPPVNLPVRVQLRLTGERIRFCRPIIFAAYACNYD